MGFLRYDKYTKLVKIKIAYLGATIAYIDGFGTN